MSSVCCPKFNPKKWDGKLLSWKNKFFIRGKVLTFFFVPVNFGSVISRLVKSAEDKGAGIADNLCLSEHTSKWNMNVLLAVSKKVPGVDNLSLSGRFLSKVYEGDYKDTGKWCDDFKIFAKKKGWEISKLYMWYVYCPKCAKKYGRNYTVIICELK